MKKKLLSIALLAAASATYADNEAIERAKDHAQPVPDASISVQSTTETVHVKSAADGALLVNKSVTVADNGEPAQIASSSQVILPEGSIINNQMDLPATLAKLSELSAALKDAPTVAAMQPLARELSDYAGQAAVLTDNGAVAAESLDAWQAALDNYRAILVHLHAALGADSYDAARIQIAELQRVEDGVYHFFAQ